MISSKIIDFREVIIERRTSYEDLKELEFNRMPGFNIKWYYDYSIDKQEMFKDDTNTREFDR